MLKVLVIVMLEITFNNTLHLTRIQTKFQFSFKKISNQNKIFFISVKNGLIKQLQQQQPIRNKKYPK